MSRIIDDGLFLVRTTNGSKIIECESELDLCESLVMIQKKYGVNLRSVCKLDCSSGDLKTPRVAVETNPVYKKMRKDFLGR